MNLRRLTIAAAVLAVTVLPSLAGSFPAGSVLVSRIGDSSNAPSNFGSKAAVLQFDNDGDLEQTVSISSGNGGLLLQADRGGRLTFSRERNELTLGGYIPPFFGAGSLSGRTEVEAERGYAKISRSGGSVSGIESVSGMSRRGPDAVVAGAGKAWIAAGDALLFWNGSQMKAIFQPTANPLQTISPRAVRAFNGRLYFVANRATGGGFLAAYNGFPTNDEDDFSIFFDVTFPQDLYVSPDGNVIYVATAEGVVDVHKREGSSWNRKYSLSGASGILAVAVDFGGSKPIAYAVTTTKLLKVVDEGKNASFKEIAKADGQAQFRGIDVVPSDPDTKPVINLGVARRFSTTNSQVTIFGTASDPDGIRSVRYRKGTKGKEKVATGKENWRFTAPRLRTGINRFFIRAVDKNGTRSATVKVVVIKK